MTSAIAVGAVNSGRVLISGSAAFLICLFVSPRFITSRSQP